MQAPPPLPDQALHGLLDDAEQCFEFGVRPGEVVGGQQPQGDDLDVGVVAPTEEVDDLRRTSGVTDRRRRSLCTGPAAVAIQDHADVLGGAAALRCFGELGVEPSFVYPVCEIGQTHVRPFQRTTHVTGSGARSDYPPRGPTTTHYAHRPKRPGQPHLSQVHHIRSPGTRTRLRIRQWSCGRVAAGDRRP
jgi:hypothetical protein